jgi:hypothetical protein
MNDIETTYNEIINTICNAICDLMENKHLYQNIAIDFSKIHERIGKIKFVARRAANKHLEDTRTREYQEPHRKLLNKFKSNFWYFDYFTYGFNRKIAKKWKYALLHDNDGARINMTAPTINIVCKTCFGHRTPHNSGFVGLQGFFESINKYGKDIGNAFSARKDIIQTFFFPYQCQKCKGEPIVFMVRRKGLKLQLVGRNHIEQIVVPDYLPNDEAEYFKNAIISCNSGYVLAGLLYLRTFIERYMRRVTNAKDKRLTGDELAEAYAKLLDEEFPNKFTSLKTVYNDLSVPLHAAKDDAGQFEKSRDDILMHFDALRLIPLKSAVD